MGGTSYDTEMPTDIPDGFIVIRDRTHPGGYRAVDPATITGGGGGGGTPNTDMWVGGFVDDIPSGPGFNFDFSTPSSVVVDGTSINVVDTTLYLEALGLYLITATMNYPAAVGGDGTFRALGISSSNTAIPDTESKIAPVAGGITRVQYAYTYKIHSGEDINPLGVTATHDAAATIVGCSLFLNVQRIS